MTTSKLTRMERELAEIKKGLVGLLGSVESEKQVVAAARKVVAARYYNGDDGWDRLKNAIGELEGLVGRPEQL